nr:hypothetical protein GCM10020092_015520 [Actinoplanes digitatis]
MTGQSIVLAADVPFPPSVEDFYLPSIAPWGEHSYWFTKITLLVWVSVAALIIFFLVSNRKPQLVPTKKQWLAESLYGFVRNNISVEMIGPRGVAFAPYLTTLFCFILLNNFFGIVPLIQISPMSHIAFPAVLAVISYVLFIAVGIRHHGFVKYFKTALIPPAPWFILPLLIPIEFFSNFLVRPFSLAVRLFRQHVRRAHAAARVHARRLRDAQCECLVRAVLDRLVGDDDRADVPRVHGDRAPGLRVHGPDRELRGGRPRRRALSRPPA